MIEFWGRIEVDIARMRYRELLQGEKHQQQLSREKVKQAVSSTERKRYRAKYPRRSVRVVS
jgi:hypothetical protein